MSSPPTTPQLSRPRTLPDIVLSIGLILIAIFSEYIPIELYIFIDSAIGRALLFAAALALLYLKGPVIGILAAVAALVLYNQALNVSYENYSDYQYRKYNGGKRHRWFIEEVLRENPKAMAVEKVETLAPNY